MYLVFKSSEKKYIIEMPEDFSTDVEIIKLHNRTELEKYLNEETTSEESRIYEFCNELSTDPMSPGHTPDSIFILKNESYRRINFTQILWIEASRSYSYIHVAGEQPIVVTFPLSEVEKKLPTPRFLRVHRSYILNTEYVDAFTRNTLYIGNQSFPVSKNYQKEVFGHFLVLGSHNDKRKKTNNEE